MARIDISVAWLAGERARAAPLLLRVAARDTRPGFDPARQRGAGHFLPQRLGPARKLEHRARAAADRQDPRTRDAAYRPRRTAVALRRRGPRRAGPALREIARTHRSSARPCARWCRTTDAQREPRSRAGGGSRCGQRGRRRPARRAISRQHRQHRRDDCRALRACRASTSMAAAAPISSRRTANGCTRIGTRSSALPTGARACCCRAEIRWASARWPTCRAVRAWSTVSRRRERACCSIACCARPRSSRLGITGYDQEEFTHLAVAATVAAGQADVGFGIEAAAAQYRLDFVPLATEQYCLALRRDHLHDARVIALIDYLASAACRELIARAARLSCDTLRRRGRASTRFCRASPPRASDAARARRRDRGSGKASIEAWTSRAARRLCERSLHDAQS